MTTIVLIVYTPIKEYIPGYDSTVLRQTAVRNIETLDSLERVIQKNQTFINSVRISYFRRSISRGAFEEKVILQE
jgi:hypothetical protein